MGQPKLILSVGTVKKDRHATALTGWGGVVSLPRLFGQGAPAPLDRANRHFSKPLRALNPMKVLVPVKRVVDYNVKVRVQV